MFTYNAKRVVMPGLAAFVLIIVPVGTPGETNPDPVPRTPDYPTGAKLVKSTVFAVIAPKVSVAVCVLPLAMDVAILLTVTEVAVAGALAGNVALRITIKTPPGATGPVSGVALVGLLVLANGVPSLPLKSAKVVPTGNALAVAALIVISKVSLPLPLLVSVLLNDTTEPWAAVVVASAGPVKVNETVWFTVNGTVLVLIGVGLPMIVPVPSL